MTKGNAMVRIFTLAQDWPAVGLGDGLSPPLRLGSPHAGPDLPLPPPLHRHHGADLLRPLIRPLVPPLHDGQSEQTGHCFRNNAGDIQIATSQHGAMITKSNHIMNLYTLPAGPAESRHGADHAGGGLDSGHLGLHTDGALLLLLCAGLSGQWAGCLGCGHLTSPGGWGHKPGPGQAGAWAQLRQPGED